MSAPPQARSAPARQGTEERLEQRLRIEPDGAVVAFSGKVEYGQGIRTGFACLVAKELAVPLDRVRIVLGETDEVPWDMGTFGSMSTATDGCALRAAAAFARTCLLERAAARFGVAVADLRLEAGGVVTRDGRRVSFQELTAGRPLIGAIPAAAGPADRAGANSVAPAGSQPQAQRLEGRDIVSGQRRFSGDVRLPGMLYARALRAPRPGAPLLSLDDTVARSLPGIVAVVREENLIGVLAEHDDQAMAGVAALIARWGEPPRASDPSVTEIVLRGDAGAAQRLDSAMIRLRADYRVEHIAHAAICPSVAVADVRANEAYLYVATQRPFGLRDEAARILGCAADRVHVHPQAMGGMFGRGGMNDAALEAVRLARAAGRPVLLQWSRAEEFRLSPHRPTLDARLEAGLDAAGRIIAWRCLSRTNPHTYGAMPLAPELVAMTSGRNAVPPYDLECAAVILQVAPGQVRTGALRSLAAAPNVFAIESFMDELAQVSGQDPVEFRLRHVRDPRLRRVIEVAAQRSGWRMRKQEQAQALGFACAIYHDTYIAQAVQIHASADGVRLERVWCAVDPGQVIWEQGARNQIEGAIQQAASWALLERLEHEGDRILTANWHDYPIATALDSPRGIEVMLVPSGAAASGLGEPGAVPVAAAIANALCAATGQRRRALPLARPPR